MRLTLYTLVVACSLTAITGEIYAQDIDSSCCKDESYWLVGGACVLNNSINTPSRKAPIKLDCPRGRYLIDPSDDPKESFRVEVGNLYLSGYDVDRGQFCVGTLARRVNGVLVPSTKQVALVCFPDTSQADNKIFVTGLLTLISVVFLCLTLAVYLILPQLRDLQGKCTMCVCFSLTLGFLSLALAQLATNQFYAIMCSANGFSIYFWMTSTFLWMNVVSINVWRSVALTRSQSKESTQFIRYSAYAWGLAVMMLLITVITNYVEGDHIRPGIGETNCWFSGRAATWLYFYGPIAMLLLCNIALFILTSKKLWSLKKDYGNVHTIRNLKFKFLMYLKLFLVMGISWIFEIVSFAQGNESSVIWYIMDVINCLQGFLFFLVLVVFRKKAMRGLAERGLLGGCSAAARRRYAAEHDDECEEIVEDNGDGEVEVALSP